MILLSGFNENNKSFRVPSIFSEVEVNGQPADDGTEPDDFTTPEPVNAAGADPAPAEETPHAEESVPEAGGEEPEDFTTDDSDNSGEPAPDADTGEDPEDFTTDGGGGDDMGGEGGEAPPEGGDPAPASGDGQVTADDARGMENELFKDLTPDQIDLKHKELKGNFTTLYDSTSNIIDRVNEIPNSDKYLSTITFVSDQLSNLRTMVADYMNNVYSTKSYMENAMNYNRFLATLKAINDILDEVRKELDVNAPN